MKIMDRPYTSQLGIKLPIGTAVLQRGSHILSTTHTHIPQFISFHSLAHGNITVILHSQLMVMGQTPSKRASLPSGKASFIIIKACATSNVLLLSNITRTYNHTRFFSSFPYLLSLTSSRHCTLSKLLLSTACTSSTALFSSATPCRYLVWASSAASEILITVSHLPERKC